MNCIHGIDARFCAACNRTKPANRPRGSNRGANPGANRGANHVSLDEILRFLNEEQIRATYGAVAEVLGVMSRSMGEALGPRRPEASWIVGASTGLPKDYTQDEWHPALLSKAEIIGSSSALLLRMSVWRDRRQT